MESTVLLGACAPWITAVPTRECTRVRIHTQLLAAAAMHPIPTVTHVNITYTRPVPSSALKRSAKTKTPCLALHRRSMSFWSGMCSSATNRPLQQLLDITYAGSGLTVCSRLHCCSVPRFVLTACSQIAAFCLSAIGSGIMHARWWRLDSRRKRQVWRLYGWFTGLMCFGSCLGAVAWVANMQQLCTYYSALNAASSRSLTRAQIRTAFAEGNRWLSAYDVMYPIEFLCLSAAKLMVLDRMFDLASEILDGTPRVVTAAGVFVMGTVLVGNVIGLGGNIAAASFWIQAANLDANAVSALSANNTATYETLVRKVRDQYRIATLAQSVQAFSEVTVLLVIIVAFLAAGLVFARYVNSQLNSFRQAAAGDSDAAARVDEFHSMRSGSEFSRLANAAGTRGRRLRLKVLATVAFVFFAFLMRGVFAIMSAVSSALQNDELYCPSGLCDSPCRNVYGPVQFWLFYTPEFQLMIVLISSPLALIVALWGMTTDSALHIMTQSKQHRMNALETSQKVGPA